MSPAKLDEDNYRQNRDVTFSVNRSEATGKMRWNIPDPLRVMSLGRLAVDLA